MDRPRVKSELGVPEGLTKLLVDPAVIVRTSGAAELRSVLSYEK